MSQRLYEGHARSCFATGQKLQQDKVKICPLSVTNTVTVIMEVSQALQGRTGKKENKV